MTSHPCLRADLVLVEQTYRGEQSFIVKDPVTHKYFRMRPVEVAVMQSLTGDQTVAEAAAALAEEGVPISERALAGFVASLSRMGLLERTVGERTVLELERLRAERRQRRRAPLFRGELLRMRWSIGDPDSMLERWMPHLRWMFTPGFIGGSILLFLVYGLVVIGRWAEFHQGLASLYTLSSYTVGKVVLVLGTSLVLIVIHELGHAVTCKHFGGHVHEMGAMLIYFQPAFYCNVNDAWTFPELRARLWVTAAGSWIQLVMAAAAAVIWWAAEPGTLVSDIALIAVVVGGATTVFANANPLMPLDGYYALSDWLEIPNLRQRAAARLGWIVKRRLLGLDVPEPPGDARERRILLLYGILSAAYAGMVFVVLGFAAYGWVRRVFGALGALALLLALFLMLRSRMLEWWHTARGALRARWAVWRQSPPFRRYLLGAALVALVVLLLPWPVTVSGPFVAAPAMQSVVTAPDSGVVAAVLVREGMRVAPGTALLTIRNTALAEEAESAAWRRDSLARRAESARAAGDVARAAELDAALTSEAALAEGLEARDRALTLRAVNGGVVATPRPGLLEGRRADAGSPLLELIDDGALEARMTLTGAGATLVRPGQPARLILRDGRTTQGIVESVWPEAPGGRGYARIRLAVPGWRAGNTGLARITLRRSTVGGAIWWRLRGLLRTDLLL